VLSDRTLARLQLLRVLAAAAGVAAVAALVALLRAKEKTVVRLAERLQRAAAAHADWPFHAALALALTFFTAVHVVDLAGSWRGAEGAEYENIALSIAAGNGFSLNESDRWFWVDFVRDESEYDRTRYYPTAIEEPVYPFLLGYSLKIFGEAGAFVVLLLQLLAWAATCVL